MFTSCYIVYSYENRRVTAAYIRHAQPPHIAPIKPRDSQIRIWDEGSSLIRIKTSPMSLENHI